MYKVATILFLIAVAPAVTGAQDAFPWVDPARHVYDFANVLPADAEARLDALAAKLRDAEKAPFYAVMVPSLAEYGGQGLQPDAYTQLLREAFQAKLPPDAAGVPEKTMVLVLIKETSQLRVDMGAGWPPALFTAGRRIGQYAQDEYLESGDHVKGVLQSADHLARLVAAESSPGFGLNPVYIAAALGLFMVAGMGALLLRWRLGLDKGSVPEAVMRQHGSLIMRRLKKGADPDAFDEHGYNAAIYAAGQGDVGVLKELSGFGADLGRATNQGETALYAAAQHGQLQSVLYLLRMGVPVDPETVHRETPLLIAAREGHVSIVRALLEAGANVNQQDNRGWSALMIAMREKQAELITLLLGHNVDVNLAPKEGAHALMMAVKQEDEELVRRLLERGADVHHVARDGMCALRIAVLRGNMAIARRLLNAGANVSAPFANKETPVETAEREGHQELAAYLRKRVKRLAACMDILEVVARGDHGRVKEIVAQVPHSVNVHSASNRWTPLLIAVRAGQLAIAATLLEHGADVHARSKEGKPAIAYAVNAGDLAMVKLLLEGGARIDQIDAEGTDLRTYAESQGQPELVEFIDAFVHQQTVGFALFQCVKDDDPPRALSLLTADPGCVDARTRHERWTPLMQAVRDDNLPMARLLLEFKAQVNLVNSRGMSALMYASRNGNLELVRMLLNAGADVRLRSRDGNTACEFALDRGHARVVMLLQEVEAQLSDWSRMGLNSETATRFDGAPPEGAEEHGRSDDIYRAIQENDIELARQVVHHWPDCVRLIRGPSELTPLHMAIVGGACAMAELLVQAGADVNAKSREGKTPLFLAVARADNALVSLLLKHGAYVWHAVQGQTALQVAQAAGYDDIVAELSHSEP